MREPELHVLTDPQLAAGRTHLEVVEAALAGGADVIQLRDKHADVRELESVAREVLALVRGAGKRLVINDHFDLARSIGADGVHLGPEDLAVSQARAGWERPALIGASVRTREHARMAEGAGADYLGVGPVFGTTTKADAPAAVGLETITGLAGAVRIPVIAIGGIAPSNAASAILAGARGVAAVSSVVSAPDIEEAVAALRAALDGVATL